MMKLRFNKTAPNVRRHAQLAHNSYFVHAICGAITRNLAIHIIVFIQFFYLTTPFTRVGS